MEGAGGERSNELAGLAGSFRVSELEVEVRFRVVLKERMLITVHHRQIMGKMSGGGGA